ncbi:hypothetical protein OsI_18748 [Oryza sativa Indica Group]|uniref:RING-CH-type domain-containing protein n=1 Tax=Oryza sativa subsp. indica TaxID=39946 RepID=A2Y164_ORYSI|nr:hypothetical protein OsI_18748 [Oryza sativa Indica Group]
MASSPAATRVVHVHYNNATVTIGTVGVAREDDGDDAEAVAKQIVVRLGIHPPAGSGADAHAVVDLRFALQEPTPAASVPWRWLAFSLCRFLDLPADGSRLEDELCSFATDVAGDGAGGALHLLLVDVRYLGVYDERPSTQEWLPVQLYLTPATDDDGAVVVLPLCLRHTGAEAERWCHACLGEFKVGDTLATPACCRRRAVHQECLRRHLAKGPDESCPLCGGATALTPAAAEADAARMQGMWWRYFLAGNLLYWLSTTAAVVTLRLADRRGVAGVHHYLTLGAASAAWLFHSVGTLLLADDAFGFGFTIDELARFLRPLCSPVTFILSSLANKRS